MMEIVILLSTDQIYFVLELNVFFFQTRNKKLQSGEHLNITKKDLQHTVRLTICISN